MTQDLTRAQFLCESKMAEFTAGISIPQAVDGAQFDSMYQDSTILWMYSVEMQQIDQDGLIAVRVTVSQNLPAAQGPATFSILRWIVDPNVILAAATAAAQAEQNAASQSGTSSSAAGGGSAR